MIDDRELFDRAIQRFVPPEEAFERLVRRRELKRRNRRIATVAVALGLFLAIIAYFGASIGLRTSQPVNPAPTPFRHNGEIAVVMDVIENSGLVGSHVVTVDPVSGRTSTLPISGPGSYPTPNTPSPSWSPDGSMVAYTLSYHLRIFDVSTGQTREIAMCRCVGSPAWSPDGSTIAVDDHAAIGLIDVETSATTMLHPLEDTGGIASLSWSPDGQRIAFIFRSLSGADELYTIRGDGSDLQAIARHASFSVTWSPDGSTIAYLVSPSRDCETGADPCPIAVKVVGADGSNTRTLLSAGRFNYFNFVPGLAWSPDGTQLALLVPSNSGSLFVISSDGTGLRLLLHGVYGRPTWRAVP